MEGARLGWVGRMIVHDQFGCISELCGKDPGGLLVGTGIPSPVDEIQQFAVMVALIDLRVKDLGDLKLWLAIYEGRQVGVATVLSWRSCLGLQIPASRHGTPGGWCRGCPVAIV